MTFNTNRKDQAAISKLIELYFDGLYYSDVERLKQIFHSQARYTTSSSGQLTNLNIQEYFALVANRASPASLKQSRTDEILFIDYTSETTASIKVKCSIAPKNFIDLLTVIKLNNRWLIISKVFDYTIQE